MTQNYRVLLRQPVAKNERYAGIFCFMAFKKISKTNIKIIALTSVCLFCLLTVFTGTFSWFQSIVQVANSAGGMEIDDEAGKLDYIEFHHASSIDYDNNGFATAYHFSKTVSGTISYDWSTGQASADGDTSFDLDAYSPMDVNHPVLMVVALRREYPLAAAGLIKITSTTETEDFIGARENSMPVYDLDDPDVYIDTRTIDGQSTHIYPLSSVVQFYSKDFSASEYNTHSSASTLDYTLGNGANDLGDAFGFVSVNNEAETSTFTQTVDSYTSVQDANKSVQYISIIIDYYPDAIEFIYSTFLGDETLEDEYDYNLYYTCDWAMEIK